MNTGGVAAINRATTGQYQFKIVDIDEAAKTISFFVRSPGYYAVRKIDQVTTTESATTTFPASAL